MKSLYIRMKQEQKYENREKNWKRNSEIKILKI